MMKAKRICWTICAGMFAVSVLTAATIPWLDYTFNLTNSLPGTLYMIHKGEEVKRGKLTICHRYDGTTYPADTTFIKRMTGVTDDVAKRADSAFWMNDRYIGTVKPFLKVGVSLQPAQKGVIRAGEYFVSTPNPNNLDSRYALTGNVKQVEVIGRVCEIL